MKTIFLLFFLFIYLFSDTIENKTWGKGQTLITFLDKHHISKDIYFNLSKTDKELCSEIEAGVHYIVSYKDNEINQLLIPISEEMQIHIYKRKQKYKLEIIPVIYEEHKRLLSFEIRYSPYQEIMDITHSKALANEFIRAFKKSVNFKKLHKKDIVSLEYIQKTRLGELYATPEILGAMIKTKYRTKYIFQNPDDGRFYDQKARSLASVYFKVPLRYKRISSKFTYKRFHPILHRYIAHLGIDYAAPRGRKVWATADGKVIFKGRKGGYGNAVMIRHSGGYRSLYAHLSRFAHIKKGNWIKQGTIIGYVGTTGRSTGPHLHFGLYKNGRAVNPAKVLSYSKKTLYGKSRKRYFKYIKSIKKDLDNYAKNLVQPTNNYKKYSRKCELKI